MLPWLIENVFSVRLILFPLPYLRPSVPVSRNELFSSGRTSDKTSIRLSPLINTMQFTCTFHNKQAHNIENSDGFYKNYIASHHKVVNIISKI